MYIHTFFPGKTQHRCVFSFCEDDAGRRRFEMRVRPCDELFYLLVIRKVRPDQKQKGDGVDGDIATATTIISSMMFFRVNLFYIYTFGRKARRTCSTLDPISIPRALIDRSDAR